MKTCVLLSGLPRQVYPCFENIYQSLILPNNADVFIHTWIDDDLDQDLLGFILHYYNPKRIKTEKIKNFINDHINLERMMNSHGRGYTRENFINMIYSSWYSNLQSNLLKEIYRLENNIEYDFVIRARFDIIYNQPIICSNYSNDKLYINYRENLPIEMIDDRFAFGPNHLMNLYCGGFSMLEYIHRKKHELDGIFCGETWVYEMMNIFNIDYKIIEDLRIHKVF